MLGTCGKTKLARFWHSPWYASRAVSGSASTWGRWRGLLTDGLSVREHFPDEGYKS